MRRLAAFAAVAACICGLPFVATAAKPPKNGGKSSLTLVANPATVTYGGTITLSGTLKGKNHANRSVGLQQNAFPFAGFKPLAFARTDSKGTYRFVIKPRRHTRYRTVTPDPATVYDVAVKSPELLEHVRIRVTIRLSKSTPRRGARVRFSGFAAPKHSGRRVLVQRRRRDGRWVTIARTFTRNATRNRSKYSRRVRIFRTALYRVRVRGHADH